MKSTIHEAAWFILVGCAAAATHWLVAVSVVGRLGVPPLAANVAGWLVAFIVSFSGHYRLTFAHQTKRFSTALGRFFLVSAAGFAVNEASYAVLLHATDIAYDYLLAGILVAIAGLTFIVSRLWAFRHTKATP